MTLKERAIVAYKKDLAERDEHLREQERLRIKTQKEKTVKAFAKIGVFLSYKKIPDALEGDITESGLKFHFKFNNGAGSFLGGETIFLVYSCPDCHQETHDPVLNLVDIGKTLLHQNCRQGCRFPLERKKEETLWSLLWEKLWEKF